MSAVENFIIGFQAIKTTYDIALGMINDANAYLSQLSVASPNIPNIQASMINSGNTYNTAIIALLAAINDPVLGSKMAAGINSFGGISPATVLAEVQKLQTYITQYQNTDKSSKVAMIGLCNAIISTLPPLQQIGRWGI